MADIRSAFAEAAATWLTSQELCARLHAVEGHPWAEFGDKKKLLSPTQLANLLRDFEIVPEKVRQGEKTLRGYGLAQFTDAFERYLDAPPPESDLLAATPPQSPKTQGECDFSRSATGTVVAGGEKLGSDNVHAGCGGVPLQRPSKLEMAEADLL